MKKKLSLLLAALLISVLPSCSSDVSTAVAMPYSTVEYRSGNWTVEELVAHFKELGFDEINISNAKESFGTAGIEVDNVLIEDFSSDSLFTEYKAFEKGEEYGTWLAIEIQTHTYIPTLTVDNCVDFSELIQTADSTEQSTDAIKSFMNLHNGEYIEYEGTITRWYDDLHWVGVSFTVSVEESEQLELSWSTIDLIELKLEGDYHYTKYKTGLINEGMRVHMIAKIVSTEKEWKLEIEEMEIIE